MMGNSKKRITKTNKAGAEHEQFRLLSHVCLEQCERRKGTELKRSIRVLQLKHQHMSSQESDFAGLCLLQGWRIVDTITSHCNDVPQPSLAKTLVSLATSPSDQIKRPLQGDMVYSFISIYIYIFYIDI